MLLKKTLFLILILNLVFDSNAQESVDVKTPPSAEELAKKLANPIASLISAPLQNNTDLGIGSNKGTRNTLNIQPVIPLSLSAKWNLIARWVQPIVNQYNVTGAGKTESGLGDAVVSAFLSPSSPKKGITWGAGPVFLVPDGTHTSLSTEKWGIGPTALALLQVKGITIGALVNQIWSFAGDANRGDLSQLFVQPFFTYNWKTGAGLGANFELTQNWNTNSTVVWFNPLLSGVTSFGKQKTQLAIGPRFNLAAPAGSKADFGIRAVIVFLFPK